MKNRLIFMFGWFTLSPMCSRIFAQVVSPASPTDTLYVVPLAGDTLPAITMKFETLILVPFLTMPGTSLFLGGHSYQIHGKKKLMASAVKPYFDATHDEGVRDLYRKHRVQRMLWYGATAAGTAVFVVGLLSRISFVPLFVPLPVYDSGNNRYLFWASGMILAGQTARIISFRTMRKAVNFYNFEYAGKPPRLSLNVGLPSATPGGLGFYLTF